MTGKKSVVLAVAVAASAAGAATAIGVSPPTPNLAVLDRASAPAVSAAQAQLASSSALRDLGFDVHAARAVAPPSKAGVNWLVGRSDNGVCLVTSAAATTCVPTATFNREGVFFYARQAPTRTEPIPTGAELEAAKKAGGFASQDVGSSSIATVYGAVPDGVSAVALLDAKGKPGISVPTPDNVYQLDNVDLSSVSGLQLIRKGRDSTVAPIGFAG